MDLFLIFAFALRVLLDLFALTRSNWIFDVAYGIFFTIVGSVLLLGNGNQQDIFFQNRQEIFGYISFILALVWGGRGLYRYKTR